MRDWRIPPQASNWMMGLGLFISLIVVVSAFADIRYFSRAASPFDQVDDSGGTDLGFVPYIVPVAGVVAPVVAPTLPSEILALNGAAQTSSPQLGVWQDPTLGEGPPPTLTPLPILLPDRLVIPAIQLEAPIVLAKLKEVEYQSLTYQQWVAPNIFAAGRLASSPSLGVPGNTVLIGHHNVYGEVFAHLADLEAGDLIRVYSGAKEFAYVIVLIMILPERFQTLEVRLQNAQWIEPSQDERLTLVTCWPYASNTHRLIIVAIPVSVDRPENDVVTPRLTPLPVLEWKFTPTPPGVDGPLPEPSVTASP